MLQQHLPFTVLKLTPRFKGAADAYKVATAPTVYGIETEEALASMLLLYLVATAPTVYGIETGAMIKISTK